MNPLRKVKLFKSDPQLHTTIDDGEGVFHGWGMNFIEFESGPGNYTVAIVERPNGTIVMRTPEYIQFIS